MPRWRQCSETGKFIPLDEAAAKHDGVAIHGDIEPFVSPLDGSVISDRKQYREHCKKHGVVPASEFSPEFYERKAKEREKHYTGDLGTRAEQWERKAAINEIINHLERQR
jgi:hypothetical protein